MRRLLAFSVLLVLLAAGCMKNISTVGQGPVDNTVIKKRQWYILWGLAPLNAVDTQTMAAGTPDYRIKTEISPTDFVLNIFTGIVTIRSRTVTLTK